MKQTFVDMLKFLSQVRIYVIVEKTDLGNLTDITKNEIDSIDESSYSIPFDNDNSYKIAYSHSMTTRILKVLESIPCVKSKRRLTLTIRGNDLIVDTWSVAHNTKVTEEFEGVMTTNQLTLEIVEEMNMDFWNQYLAVVTKNDKKIVLSDKSDSLDVYDIVFGLGLGVLIVLIYITIRVFIK